MSELEMTTAILEAITSSTDSQTQNETVLEREVRALVLKENAITVILPARGGGQERQIHQRNLCAVYACNSDRTYESLCIKKDSETLTITRIPEHEQRFASEGCEYRMLVQNTGTGRLLRSAECTNAQIAGLIHVYVRLADVNVFQNPN